MPIFIAALVGGLVQAASSFVGRALLALGLGYVSYQGIDIAMNEIRSTFLASASGFSPQIVGMLGVFKIGTGFNILMSSIMIRLTLNGLTSGAIKKLVIK